MLGYRVSGLGSRFGGIGRISRIDRIGLAENLDSWVGFAGFLFQAVELPVEVAAAGGFLLPGEVALDEVEGGLPFAVALAGPEEAFSEELLGAGFAEAEFG